MKSPQKSPKKPALKSPAKSSRHASASRRPDRATEARALSAERSETIRNWLQLAQLRTEKCELDEAGVALTMALEEAKAAGDLRAVMEAISGLLRLAGEALDDAGMERWCVELDELMAAFPRQIPPMAWYCKGTVAWYRREVRLAQRCFHRYLRAVRRDPENGLGLLSPEESLAKGWLALASMWRGNKPRRAKLVALLVLKHYGAQRLSGVNGIARLVLASLASEMGDLYTAIQNYQEAHASFLAEHNWYYHLYVLLGYARVNRIQKHYAQAYWYLDLIDKAAAGHYFGQLRREVALERARLEQDAVDLLIDGRKGIISTRESKQISLGKQYVLLHILEALSGAHGRPGDDTERGLSKAEIIERVWKENYRPEAHDNKLYYNINRLRKLIEPDIKSPQYLLNWKEGYRLAPGLRVHFVGKGNGGAADRVEHKGE